MLPPEIVFALFGLLVGSFLNVCIHRIPLGQSIVSPGSRCPKCAEPIRPYDNIPVLSYLFLRARCRFCRAPISARYPFVELLTGTAYYLCGRTWGDSLAAAVVNSIFLSLVIALVFIDYDHQILPNVITLPGTVLGIAVCSLQAEGFYRDSLSWSIASAIAPSNAAALLPWVGSLVGALVGGGSLFAVAWIYERVRHHPGLGMGDVKMMAMVGAFLGWRLALFTIFVGSFGGSIIGLLLIAFRGRTLQTRLAFGTFLGFGAGLAVFLGLPFLEWYTQIR
jgi:leader peptidase (prepilin peptidase) / N-methyltransferase